MRALPTVPAFASTRRSAAMSVLTVILNATADSGNWHVRHPR
ncbi:MAG TPA: hypothetical protein VNY27_10540 [Solirubrobacteraceae bacterium]|nr:hypothetical protein [Solirubrobacteraceae bacterium]